MKEVSNNMIWRKDEKKQALADIKFRHKLAEMEQEERLIKARADALIKAYRLGTMAPEEEPDFKYDLAKSWKDEFFLFLYTAPVILLFVPPCQDTIVNGFRIINETLPSLYLNMLVIMTITVWGVNRCKNIISSVKDSFFKSKESKY